ncbi:MAG TPA: hypothetical protein VD886_17430 [Herpetosiphonaceae bacterium]|nr:hypothetical protein [Herpetosiphonaceae bacterium]
MRLKNPLLVSYWIKTPDPRGPLGFGVTAYSPEGAFMCIEQAGYSVDPSACTLQEVRDFDALDDRYVRANSGPLIFRGVWYPRQILGTL